MKKAHRHRVVLEECESDGDSRSRRSPRSCSLRATRPPAARSCTATTSTPTAASATRTTTTRSCTRQPGRSHPHTFFGNASADANSTLASLRKARTTCKPSADKAAYWVPTLFHGNREIRPQKAQFYFNLRGYDQMHPFPAGLKMVAGNAHAFSPQSTNVVYWACATSESARSAPLHRPPPSCADVPLVLKKGFFRPCATCPSRPLPPPRAHQKRYLELHVNFPDCWDGKHLDSPDHQSHMAYSRAYVCPASHPVKVPLIRLNVQVSPSLAARTSPPRAPYSPATPTSSTPGTKAA